MGNFAVRLVHGPNWDPRRPIRGQDRWDEHAAFMDGLVDDGFIILGGPVGVAQAAQERCARRAPGRHAGSARTPTDVPATAARAQRIRGTAVSGCSP
jgi:hypothetical protein